MIILKQSISECNLCQAYLPFPPKPIFQFNAAAKLIVIGQAPGKQAHDTGKPWNDKSGERLRDWLGISNELFYNEKFIALVPMGFCYPGKGKSGDLPPRKECAPKWHAALFASFQNQCPRLLVGSYAQNYYLKDNRSLTERCENWRDYGENTLPLPHPSPRNNIWIKKNPWFEAEVLPEYRKIVRSHLSNN